MVPGSLRGSPRPCPPPAGEGGRPVGLVVDPLSSASLRVLCALDFKGIALPLHVVRLRAGEQHGEAHRALNPAGAVPVLLLDDGQAIPQSMAILELLEAFFPQDPLLPADPLAAARVRSLCGLVAADIHPLANLRVREHVAQAQGDEAAREWVHHWSSRGWAALEGWLERWSGRFCCGDALTLADFFLVPALFTLQRLGSPAPAGSHAARIWCEALPLPAFARIAAACGAPH